jgi:hypothetical protein
VLLSRTGTRNFIEFVPWLVLIATIVIVLWPILVRRDEGGSVHPNITMALWPVAIAGIFLVALYGGYFGAGIGILMIGALSFRSWQEHDDARQEHERPWQECDEYWQRSHLQDDYEPECRSPLEFWVRFWWISWDAFHGSCWSWWWPWPVGRNR